MSVISQSRVSLFQSLLLRIFGLLLHLFNSSIATPSAQARSRAMQGMQMGDVACVRRKLYVVVCARERDESDFGGAVGL